MNYHLKLSISGAIRNKMFKGIVVNGVEVPPKIAEAHLKILESQGVKYLKVGECDNWSEDEGCLGHERKGSQNG